MLRRSTAYLICSNALSGVFAFIILGLIGDNLSYVFSDTAQHGSTIIVQNVTVNGEWEQRRYMMAYLPEDLRLGSYWLMLTLALLVPFSSIFIFILMAYQRRQLLASYHAGQSVPPMRISSALMIATAAINLLLSTAATLYAFIEWQRSGTFDPSIDTSQSHGRYPSVNDTWFTPDAWNCQLEDYIPFGPKHIQVNNICNEGTTARSLPLVLSVLSLVVLGTAIWKLQVKKDAMTLTMFPLGDTPAVQESGFRHI